jgi:hypothetical protein
MSSLSINLVLLLSAAVLLSGCKDEHCCDCGPSWPWAANDCPCYSLGLDVCLKSEECAGPGEEYSYDICRAELISSTDTGCLWDCERIYECRSLIEAAACGELEQVVESCSDLCMGWP